MRQILAIQTQYHRGKLDSLYQLTLFLYYIVQSLTWFTVLIWQGVADGVVYRCCNPKTLRFNVLCIQRSSSVYKNGYLSYSCLYSRLAILTLYLSLIRHYFIVLPLDRISFLFWLLSAIWFFMVILVAHQILKESSKPLTLLTMAYSMSLKFP